MRFPAIRIAALAALLVFAACAACAGAQRPQIDGRIASGGGFLGAWDFYPSTCASRGDEVFLIEDRASPQTVRLIDRSNAPWTRNAKVDVRVARVTDKGAMDLSFTDPACVQSSLQSSPKGYSGQVSLDCVTGEGGHVVGKITFAGCR
jgi:hypothetical protein